MTVSESAPDTAREMWRDGQVTVADLNQWMTAVSKLVSEAVDDLQAAGADLDEWAPKYRRRFVAVYESREWNSVAEGERAAKNAAVEERVRMEGAQRRCKRAEQVLKARMAQLSSFQSMASSVREEAKFTRTGVA